MTAISSAGDLLLLLFLLRLQLPGEVLGVAQRLRLGLARGNRGGASGVVELFAQSIQVALIRGVENGGGLLHLRNLCFD